MTLIHYIRLNLLYLLNLIRCQFYFTIYQTAAKAAPLYVNIFKIDVLWLNSLFSEVTSCRSLVYFNFPTISMLIKMGNSHCRSSHQRRPMTKAVLKDFTIFSRKRLGLSLFLTKLKPFRPAILFKKDFNMCIFLWILRNF